MLTLLPYLIQLQRGENGVPQNLIDKDKQSREKEFGRLDLQYIEREFYK